MISELFAYLVCYHNIFYEYRDFLTPWKLGMGGEGKVLLHIRSAALSMSTFTCVVRGRSW